MGWLVSIALFIGWCVSGTQFNALLIASGLFAIAGAISFK